MARVFVRTVTDYNPSIKIQVKELLDRHLRGSITPATRVLIKPNLLTAAALERAIATHPMIVRAAVEYALDHQASVQVSDSPALGPFRRILRATGLAEALQGLDVNLTEFRDSVSVEVGEPLRRLEIAREAVQAEVVINLAKLKTHSQMLLTLGVKNLFGCVVGVRKPNWHMRLGVDRERFADLLVRIYQVVHPAVTLIDGVLALAGDGPGFGGKPRPVGCLLAAADAVAADMAVCRLLGLDLERLPTNRAAARLGLVPAAVEIDGALPTIRDFELPEISSSLLGPPRLQPLIRRHLLQRPQVHPDACRQCGECWSYCPARAISRAERGVSFDYGRCIRCYCCLEICPQGAITTVEPTLGRLLRKVSRGRWIG